MYRLSTSLFQALRWWGRRKRVGKTRKRKARVAPPLPSFLSCLCSRFLNFRGPTVYAHRIFVVIGSLFLNIRFHSILINRKKKEVKEEEKSSSTVGVFVILDNVSSSPSWSPEKRRLVHNRKSSVQTYCSFNQLISRHLKDFILDDIQTINFLPSRLYYDSVHIAIIEKASSRFDCEQSLPFLLRHFIMRARARGERRTREERGRATISPPFLHL